MAQGTLDAVQAVPQRQGNQVAKRIMDVGFCLLILPFILPLMGLIAFLIWLDSPGPLVFRQVRVGKGGHHFGMYKFRSMRHELDDSHHRSFMRAFVTGEIGNAEETVHKPFEESEVTRLGRVLRKTSLDELPQLFNVLKGEMSLVGPRPNVPWEVEVYQEWHRARLAVLPGITGLAQVHGRSCISFDQIVEYDLEYIQRHSVWLDIRILWRTASSVLMSKGAM
jgi:lipopolysaccharide/colanic/teichoic acid biosynthesis glycosyltransferase